MRLTGWSTIWAGHAKNRPILRMTGPDRWPAGHAKIKFSILYGVVYWTFRQNLKIILFFDILSIVFDKAAFYGFIQKNMQFGAVADINVQKMKFWYLVMRINKIFITA